MTQAMTSIQIEHIIEKIKTAIGDHVSADEVKLDHPADIKFGDYTTNVAMIIAKKEGKNPNEIAKDIAKKIEADEIIEKVEVVGGYINFFLTSKFLKETTERLNYEIEFREYMSKYGKGKTMVIDYSAPNIAKPFGIGHLRSTNIGQALYNTYKILGWNCIGDNHLGDWGTQFGKMITAIKRWADKPIVEMSIDDLEKLYVKFHSEAESDENLVIEGRKWFEKLEKGDSEARDIWQKCVDISLKEFNRVYDLLDVKIDYALGESFYEKKLPEIVELFKKKKLVSTSQGALIVNLEKNPPAILLKSDGATNYLTRDLATIQYRQETWNPDLYIYEVGSEQKLYFSQLFESAQMAGWTPTIGYKHIGHGLIRWKNGKFSTRKGDTIHLADVIDNAMEQAKNIAPNNDPETISAVAIGAIKFNDLASDPTKDVIFDWDKVMSMEGNSGPYLQYTYARCQSVLSKTSVLEQKNIEEIPTEVSNEESSLIRELYKFEEKIVESASRFSPAVIAEFLLSVARKYNEFYSKNRIIDDKNEVWRVFLTKATSSTIKTGLSLLGIKTVEKM